MFQLDKAIINKRTIELNYQSFKAKTASIIIVYPYLLKEYRNRWFILGASKKGKNLMTLALDRIIDFKELPGEKYHKPDFDIATFYDDCIGASKMLNQRPQQIVMKITKENAPYVITKPLHHTQKVLKEEDDGMIFSIQVVWNFELEREILGFGECLKVLSPKRLQNKIAHRLQKAGENYLNKTKETL